MNILEIMINVTLSQLETFIAVVERGGFNAAGKHLNISQSAVSLRVSQLEQRLGVKLLDRTTRSVTLTREGGRLINTARHTLHDIGRLVFQLSDESALNRGRFKMAALPSTAATIVPIALDVFQRRYPNISIQVVDCVADRAISAVLSGDVELALTTRPERSAGLVFEPLFEDECLIVVSVTHELSKCETVVLEQLLNSPLLLPVIGSGFRSEIDAAFAAAGLKPIAAHEAINLATLMAYAEVGMGVAFVPSIMRHRLDLSRCRAIPLTHAPLIRTYGILRSDGRSLPAASAAFVDQLRNIMSNRVHLE